MSDIKITRITAKKRMITFIPITVFIALFSFIYELNGHGIYSNYMIYAFVPTFLGGVVFWLLVMLLEKTNGLHKIDILTANTWFVNLWSAAIATITMGMLFKGALDIYGTTSNLTKVYWIVTVILFVLAIISVCIGHKQILPKK